MKIRAPKKIVISRTDSIGDVALTLPMVSILKQKFPEAAIIFLGNTYTKPIISCLNGVDEIWSWADIQDMEDRQQLNWIKEQHIDVFIHVFPRREIARLVRKAGIPHRIGTSHRLFHMLTCNHLVNFTRKNSDLHEGQLNLKLLKPLGISKAYGFDELKSVLTFTSKPLSQEFKTILDSTKTKVILHPKSKGSALEWGVSNFIDLAKRLPDDQFQVFFTGTEEESTYFRDLLPKTDHIIDLSGRMTLDQLIAFIQNCDVLIAASTGPLHIAGLSNIISIGLFTTRRPLHPGRWSPIGNQVHIITESEESERHEALKISVDDVLGVIKKVT